MMGIELSGGARRRAHPGFGRLSTATAMLAVALSLPVGSASAETPAGEAPPAVSQGFGDIVVTAQKRSQKTTDVPVAVSVITGETLLNKGASSVVDFVGSVPGVSVINSGAPGLNGIVIRGLSTGYSNSFNAPLVVVYVDDQPVSASAGGFGGARGGSYTIDLMPYDLAGIEVLRGPQGTLYGAAAMGGILKYSLKRPDLEKTDLWVGGDLGHVAASGGVDWGARAALNLPLIPGELALRVSGYGRKTAGYIDNIGIGKADSNSSQTYGGRASLRFKPTPTLDIEATALIQRIRSDDNSSVSLIDQTDQPAYGRYVQSTRYAQPFRQNAENYALRINWDIGFATLTDSTSYSKAVNAFTLDLSAIAYVPSAPRSLIPYYFTTSEKKFTQETRLASHENGKFQWMVGGFYTREAPDEYDDFRAYSAYGVPLPAPNDILLLGTTPGSRNVYQEWALFTNGTYHFTDKFDVGAGVRYGQNKAAGCDPGFIGIYGNGGVYACTSRPADSVATWMVDATYHFQRDAMMFARVATGYRPGGGCDTCGNPATQVPGIFKPDRLINYELGFKGLLLDRRLQFEASLFYIDWTDIQLKVTNSLGLNYSGNGKTAVSRGAEVNASYAFGNGLQIGGFIDYTDAHLTADAPGVGGRDGDQLPGSAKWSGAINADYKRKLASGSTLIAGASYHYKGAANNQFAGTLAPYRMGPQNIVDLYAGVEFSHMQLKFYVKNLTNDRSYTGLTYLSDRTRPLFTPVQPLTVGGQIDYHF